jgi:hypothetical protein
MIEVTALPASHTLCFCLKGVQSATEFGTLSNTLPPTDSQRRWRVLFDWIALEGWDDRRKFNLSCQGWHSTADLIARVSIVHRHRWNHQAALLAAVFRVHGVQVRSWPTSDRTQALGWLSD